MKLVKYGPRREYIWDPETDELVRVDDPNWACKQCSDVWCLCQNKD